jgi:hypothetical protein
MMGLKGKVLAGMAAMCLSSAFVYFFFLKKHKAIADYTILPPNDNLASASESVLVVTRVHMKAASAMPNPQKVLVFVTHLHSYASKILICVGADDDAIMQLAALRQSADILNVYLVFICI